MDKPTVAYLYKETLLGNIKERHTMRYIVYVTTWSNLMNDSEKKTDRLRRLHTGTAWFHLNDILKKTKLQEQKIDQWLSGLGVGAGVA